MDEIGVIEDAIRRVQKRELMKRALDGQMGYDDFLKEAAANDVLGEADVLAVAREIKNKENLPKEKQVATDVGAIESGGMYGDLRKGMAEYKPKVSTEPKVSSPSGVGSISRTPLSRDMTASGIPFTGAGSKEYTSPNPQTQADLVALGESSRKPLSVGAQTPSPQLDTSLLSEQTKKDLSATPEQSAAEYTPSARPVTPAELQARKSQENLPEESLKGLGEALSKRQEQTSEQKKTETTVLGANERAQLLSETNLEIARMRQRLGQQKLKIDETENSIDWAKLGEQKKTNYLALKAKILSEQADLVMGEGALGKSALVDVEALSPKILKASNDLEDLSNLLTDLDRESNVDTRAAEKKGSKLIAFDPSNPIHQGLFDTAKRGKMTEAQARQFFRKNGILAK